MFFLRNLQSFGRHLKPRIPLQQNVIEAKLMDQNAQIQQLSLHHVMHSQTIEQLITLYNDTHSYVDLTSQILYRINRIQLSDQEFSRAKEFILQLITEANDVQNGLNLMNYFENELIEKALLKSFQLGKLEHNDDTSLKMLEIITKYGTQQDIDKWTRNPQFKLNAKSVTRFYRTLDQLSFNLENKFEIIRDLESYLPKYIHILNFQTLITILKHRTYNDKALNEELLYCIIKRLINLDLNLQQITEINQYLFIDLKYNNITWINYVGKKVILEIYPQQLEQEQDQEQVNQEIEQQEQELKIQENENEPDIQYLKNFQLNQKPKILGELEITLIKLMEQFTHIYITNDMNLMIIQFYKEMDGHIMSYFNQLTSEQQVSCYKFHSKLIEAYYNEGTKDLKTYKKSSLKRLEQMNNSFYDITLSHIKELGFQQSLSLLEAASVLGVSKRKVCQKIMKIAMAGLEKNTESTLTNDQLNYTLLTYYRLMKKFVTKAEEFEQIEEQFNKIKVNTLQLQTEYGHLAIDREKVQNISLIQ